MARHDDENIGGKEYDPVYWQFDGDKDAAKRLTGLGRKLLGEMKNRMRLGELLWLSNTVKLDDGTVFHMSSNQHGLVPVDKVQVFVPPSGGKRHRVLGYIVRAYNNLSSGAWTAQVYLRAEFPEKNDAGAAKMLGWKAWQEPGDYATRIDYGYEDEMPDFDGYPDRGAKWLRNDNFMDDEGFPPEEWQDFYPEEWQTVYAHTALDKFEIATVGPLKVSYGGQISAYQYTAETNGLATYTSLPPIAAGYFYVAGSVDTGWIHVASSPYTVPPDIHDVYVDTTAPVIGYGGAPEGEDPYGPEEGSGLTFVQWQTQVELYNTFTYWVQPAIAALNGMYEYFYSVEYPEFYDTFTPYNLYAYTDLHGRPVANFLDDSPLFNVTKREDNIGILTGAGTKISSEGLTLYDPFDNDTYGYNALIVSEGTWKFRYSDHIQNTLTFSATATSEHSVGGSPDVRHAIASGPANIGLWGAPGVEYFEQENNVTRTRERRLEASDEFYIPCRCPEGTHRVYAQELTYALPSDSDRKIEVMLFTTEGVHKREFPNLTATENAWSEGLSFWVNDYDKYLEIQVGEYSNIDDVIVQKEYQAPS